ncbi:MAG TPA: hypothetical protein PK253_08385 [Spirochaetota bacterium]|nr:hypothetical protein [Spirochaetota bacterium]
MLGTYTIDTANISELTGQVQDRSDINGPFLADAIAFANITGYPIGKATLGSFPHFEFGAAVGAGCTNMDYFADKDAAKAEGSFPMIVPNPVFHFGFGIAGGFDFIGKIMTYDSKMYLPDYEKSLATPQQISVYSFGGRLRYNLVEGFTIVPFLLSFGGITVSVGGDFMGGTAKITGTYETTFKNITVNLGIPQTVDLDFTGSYEAEITYAMYSGTVNMVAFVDIFTLFSFYSGMGMSAGSGYFKAKFDGTGTLSYSGTDVGSLTFNSENKYRPHIFIPHYILGLEINLFMLKFNAETMVNLRNGEDVTALVGVRFQF